MAPSGMMCVQRNMHAHSACSMKRMLMVVHQFQIMDTKWND